MIPELPEEDQPGDGDVRRTQMQGSPGDEAGYQILPLITFNLAFYNPHLGISAHHTDESCKAGFFLTREVIFHQIILLHPSPQEAEEVVGLGIIDSIVGDDLHSSS